MTRYYNKQKEMEEKWQGPVCPKIRKKVSKNANMANNCFILPTGKRIFQVQHKDFSYIVDIQVRHCDCRRWDMIGIPCCHAISCLRNERIPAELVLPACYTTEAYLKAYGHHIWPCSDKTKWEKVNGLEVKHPVYDKKVGKPKKCRRKQPQEVQGKNGPKISKHGVEMYCSYCQQPGHNKKGCPLRKAGLRPKQQPKRKITPLVDDEAEANLELVVAQDVMQPCPSNQSYPTNTMLSQMVVESSRPSKGALQAEPLSDSAYILSNQPSARPAPLTTATKEGSAITTSGGTGKKGGFGAKKSAGSSLGAKKAAGSSLGPKKPGGNKSVRKKAVAKKTSDS